MPSGIYQHKPLSDAQKKQLSLARMAALHEWVSSRLPRPELCQKCNLKPVYDLANKGIYNRDLENWEWLCRSCHTKSDGRTERLIINAARANTGRKQTEEHKRKRGLAVSIALKGYKQTEEHKRKRFANAKTGVIMICKVCKKEFYVLKSRMSKRKYCSNKCFRTIFN